jgi:two-component system NtrC family sensor kinase
MQQRSKTIRLIRFAMAAAVLLPCALFAFASWTAYRNLHVLADERLLRSLDVLQEEAAKTFELTNLTISNTSDLVAGMSGGDIRQDGERLHGQFKKYSDAVGVIQSIWIYDADGRALVSSSVFPPPEQSFADRDFFVAHVKGDVGIYYGQVYPSSLNGGPFFTVSKRLSHNGEFVGVLEVSVLPSNFFKFFAAVA